MVKQTGWDKFETALLIDACEKVSNGTPKQEIIKELRAIKDGMWKTGTFFEEFYNRLLFKVKCLYTKIMLSKPDKDIVNNGK